MAAEKEDIRCKYYNSSFCECQLAGEAHVKTKNVVQDIQNQVGTATTAEKDLSL